MNFKEEKGYSLIELLIYVAIFAGSAVFLTAILLSVTRIQTRQNSVNEVNNQISFVAGTVQQLVRDSNLIDMESGTATSTISLRMASSTLDPTLIYASGTAIYLSEGDSYSVEHARSHHEFQRDRKQLYGHQIRESRRARHHPIGRHNDL